MDSAAEQPLRFVDGAILGPYEILSPLRTGGVGGVYRARTTKLQRDVALKILPQAMAQAWLHRELSGKKPDE